AQGSVELWGYASDLSSARNLFVYTADNGLATYSHQIGVRPDGSVKAYLWDGSMRTATTGPGLVASNQWHQYVLTWVDSGQATLYVDGTRQASVALGSSWKGGNKVLFGHASGSSSGLTNAWQGRIDEAAVYNSALPATTIQQQYDAGLGPPGPGAVTGAATSGAPTSATLNGTVNPDGEATTYHFDYGTTAAYGSEPAASIRG